MIIEFTRMVDLNYMVSFGKSVLSYTHVTILRALCSKGEITLPLRVSYTHVTILRALCSKEEVTLPL